MQMRRLVSCLYLCKDTNFLANHNFINGKGEEVLLFIPVQRYEFFS